MNHNNSRASQILNLSKSKACASRNVVGLKNYSLIKYSTPKSTVTGIKQTINESLNRLLETETAINVSKNDYDSGDDETKSIVHSEIVNFP